MHDDFVDGEGNPQELHGVKKYWWVKTEGNQDYFFDFVPTMEEMPLPLLPDAIEMELDGGHDGGQIYLLSLGLLTLMMTTNLPLRTFPF